MDETKAWDLYWETGALESCVTQSDALVQGALESFWREFSEGLNSQAKVLDLATGNGSVINNLLKFNANMHVTGVDRAQIKPDPNLLMAKKEQVSLVSNTDIKKMSFTDGSFQLVTSQFGIEYALTREAKGVDDVIAESSRILEKHGKAQFLIHHNQSSLVKSNRTKLDELRLILKEDGLASHLYQFAQGKSNVGNLERAGKAHLDSPQQKSEAISGQLFNAIAYFIRCYQSEQNTNELKKTIEETLMRVQAECSRLDQLCQSALSEEDFVRFCKAFQSLGFDIIKSGEFTVINSDNTYDLLAWQFIGQKNN